MCAPYLGYDPLAMSMYTESLRAFLKPVLQYLDDETVSEIMINGPEDIWIEKKGDRFQVRLFGDKAQGTYAVERRPSKQ